MIRKEEFQDVAAVRKVNVAAFPSAVEADLVERMRANGRLDLSLVFEADGEIAGHVAFSRVTVESNPAGLKGAGLAPVAVLPSHQRQGVAAALIRRGLEDCKRADVAFVVVLGEPHYYRRFGFETAATHGLGNEYGAQNEFMVLELQPGALQQINGLVRYCEDFAELS